MSQVIPGLRYSPDHEWARTEGDEVAVGITDHAQGELGDIVFVELPKIGDKVQAGDSFGTIEAVKTVAELYAPVSGEVVAVNESLADAASVINEDPYGKGWVVRIRCSDPSELDRLLDASAYEAHIN